MATAMEIDVISTAKHASNHLDHFRQVYESQAHWHARKTFIQHNWDNFLDKDKLICLSTAWANINFMGNRYPQQIMIQLKEIEKGLPCIHDLLKEGETLVTGVIEPAIEIEEDHVHEIQKLPASIKPMRFVKEIKSDEPCAELSSETIKKFEMSSITRECLSLPSDKKSNKSKKTVSVNKTAANSKVQSVCQEVAPPLSVIIANARKKKRENDDVASANKKTKLLSNSDNKKKTLAANEPVISEKTLSSLSKEVGSTDAPKKYSPLSRPPHPHLCDFVKLLSSVLKDEFHKFNETNKISAFNEIVQKVKTNPVFVCFQIKENNIKQYDVWAESVGFVHSMKYGTWVCDLYIYNLFVCQGHGSSKAASKNFAINRALDLLYSPNVHVIVGERLKVDSSKVVQTAVSNQSSSLNESILPPLLVSPDLPHYSFTESTSNRPVMKRKNNILIPKKLVIVERPCSVGNYPQIVQHSTQFSRLSLDYVSEFVNHQFKCTVVIDGIEIASAFALNTKDAKTLAAEDALSILKENCPCVMATGNPAGNPSDALKRNEVVGKSKSSSWSKAISDDNMGNKLLRKMGWSGTGGLGKAGKGIATPVQVEGTFDRTGLGHEADSNRTISYGDAHRVIVDYVKKNCAGELTFSPDLTLDERKKIHTIANRFGLKSKSYGKDGERYLVVCRKVSAEDVMNALRSGDEQCFSGFTLVSK